MPQEELLRLFAAAVDEGDEAAIASLLDRECHDRPSLRAEVEGLLEAHRADDSFLSPGAGRDLLLGPTPPPGPLDSTGWRHRTGSPPGDGGDPSEMPLSVDGYENVRLIGRGGMGTVLKAWDPALRRVVALKVMSPLLAFSDEAIDRFRQEARAAAAITHDHVVRVYAVDDTQRPPVLVMEFVDGESLEQRVARGPAPLEIPEAVRIATEVTRGLQAAHDAGLVHRDIKPSNILLDRETGCAKLADFGLARAADGVEMTRTGTILGTPLFMSPEQARGEQVDCRSDLFSVGSVLYALVAGRPAFQADTLLATIQRICGDDPRPIGKVRPETPAWLQALIHRLLAKDPGERYQSAEALVEDLRLETATTAARRGKTGGVARRLKSRGTVLVSGGVLAGVVLSLLMVTLFSRPSVTGASPNAAAAPSNARSDTAPLRRNPAVELLTSPRWTWTDPVEIELSAEGLSGIAEPSLSSDGLELVFAANFDSDVALFSSRRASETDPFETAVRLDAVDSTVPERWPKLSADGLRLHFMSQRTFRPYGPWPITLWTASRPSADKPFGAPQQVAMSKDVESWRPRGACVSEDGLALYFHTDRPRTEDLWVATRSATDEPFDDPVNLGPAVNTAGAETSAFVTPDECLLLFDSNVDGRSHIYAATRQSRAVRFDRVIKLSEPVNLENCASASPTLSADGKTLVFRSDRGGEPKLWVSRRVQRSSQAE